MTFVNALAAWWQSMTVDQWFLAAFSLTAAWLVNDPRPDVRRWGAVAGLCSQPFWFYTAIMNGQPGIIFMAGIYTMAWSRGIYYGWFHHART